MRVFESALIPDGLVASGIVVGYNDLLTLLEMPSPNVKIGRCGYSVDDGAGAEAQDLGVDRLDEGPAADVRNVDHHLTRV